MTIMRMLVILIVEKTETGWSAWLRNSPCDVCTGESDVIAIMTLIETYGSLDMDAWDMTRLDARSRDGHVEYLLPCAVRRRSCEAQFRKTRTVDSGSSMS